MMPFDDFLMRSLGAGVAVALATGPLGSLIIWRRMAYFGDATAHAALLGVALALILHLPVGLGTLGIALLMAGTVALMARRGWAIDTTLGVLSHTALAAGLVVISFLPSVRNELSGWLFGDILAISSGDFSSIIVGALGILALLIWRWPKLLLTTINEELAAANGLSPLRERMILVLALAAMVAVAIKIVGALFITAMLILPAAAARPLARSPEMMALGAAIIGVCAVFGGLGLSVWQDTPAGPSIILTAAVIFAVTGILGRVIYR